MGYRTWVYKSKEEAKIIDSDDKQKYLDDGWADSPAAFIDIKEDFGIEPDNTMEVQGVGSAIDGVAKYHNNLLNIEKLTRKELDLFAKNHWDLDLDRRKTVKNMLHQVAKHHGFDDFETFKREFTENDNGSGAS